jgi:hypothetical protein
MGSTKSRWRHCVIRTVDIFEASRKNQETA